MKFFRSLGLLILLLLISTSLWAGEFELETDILGQIRENEAGLTEFPLNGYLGMAADKPKWHISAETNMRLFHDFSREWDDYDLYQAVLHWHPSKKVSLDFGRQFLNEGFSAETIDGIRLGLVPYKYLGLILYSGMPRTVELGDFNENDGLLTGMSLGLQNIKNVNARLHVAWRKNNARVNDLRENDSVNAGADFSYLWNSPIEMMVYGLFEYNVTGNMVDVGTIGLDVYPLDRVSLNLEFDYFNIDRRFDRETILSLFTTGRTLLGNFSSTVTLIPDFWDLMTNVSIQRIEIQDHTFRSGYVINIDLPITIGDIGFYVQPGYYFTRSFGGTLHGIRATIHEDFTDKLYSDLNFDFTTYDKITNDNDNAFSFVAWTGYEVLKGLVVAAGFEYNRNNLFDRDIRGTMQIKYHYRRKI